MAATAIVVEDDSNNAFNDDKANASSENGDAESDEGGAFSNDEFDDDERTPAEKEAHRKKAMELRPKLRSLQSNSNFRAKMISILHPYEFYMLHVDDLEEFDEMQDLMDQYCNRHDLMPPMIHRLTYHQYVFAYSMTFEKWCRAQFMYPAKKLSEKYAKNPLDMAKNLSASVHLLDYGYTDTVLQMHIRPTGSLQYLFNNQKWPLRRLKCSLYGIRSRSENKNWTQSEVNELKRQCQNKILRVFPAFMENDTYKVSLKFYLPEVTNDISVELCMVFMDAAFFCEEITGAHVPGQKASYKETEMPDVGDVRSAICVHVESPDLFYVYLNTQQKQVYEIQDKLNNLYDERCKDESNYRLLCPEVDQPCVTRYDLDGLFYRSLIIGIPEEGRSKEINVRYVDFGNEETVASNEVYFISDDFLESKILSIPCKLYGVGPPVGEHKYSEKVKTVMQELMLEDSDGTPKLMSMEVVAKDQLDSKRFVAYVNIKVLNKDTDTYTKISEELIRQRLLRSTLGEPSTPRLPVTQTLRVDCYKTLGDIQDRNQCAKAGARVSLIPVTVTRAESPGQFWVRLADPSIVEYFQVMEMKLGMQMEYESEKTLKQHPNELKVKFEINKACTFYVEDEYSGADRIWFRGEVIARKKEDDSIASHAEGEYYVLAVDTGGLYTVARKKIFSIPEEYMNPYPFALECALSDLKAIGGQDGKWAATAVDSFRDWTVDKPSDTQLFILLKQTLPPAKKGPILVDLIYMKEKICGPFDSDTSEYFTMNRKLVDIGYAIPATPEERKRTADLIEDLNHSEEAPELEESVKLHRLAHAVQSAKIETS